jgi:hypothetical protein
LASQCSNLDTRTKTGFDQWGNSKAGRLVRVLGAGTRNNIDKLEQAVHPLLDNITELANRLPFTPVDLYELWLLDTVKQQSVVLLASTSKPPLTSPKPPRWHAALTTDLGFIAPSFPIEIAPDEADSSRPRESHLYREAIEQLIRQAAAPVAQWY